jgi:CheY-like chemotaxis protein
MSTDVKILVLVADDNEGIRDTTAAILRAVGYTVTEAPDGQVALEEIAKVTYDVVLLDVQMPVQDGISVVEALMAESPPPVIMMVSAYDFDADTRAHLNRRVFKYLKKPVPPNELIEAVGLAAAY